MIHCLKAIMYKEGAAMKYHLKSTIFSIIVFFILMLSSSVMKQNNNNISVAGLSTYAFYISSFVSFVGMITTLKFWQEKSAHTLDSLLSLPFNIRKILISKVLFSVYIGLLITIISYILLTIIYFILYTINIFNLFDFMFVLALTVLFNFSYAIINGYAMWSMSIGTAKIVQIFTYVIYLSGISGIIGVDMSTGISNTTFFVLIAAVLLLAAIAFVCIISIRKEKVIKRQLY